MNVKKVEQEPNVLSDGLEHETASAPESFFMKKI
jgi:hypothetical protein